MSCAGHVFSRPSLIVVTHIVGETTGTSEKESEKVSETETNKLNRLFTILRAHHCISSLLLSSLYALPCRFRRAFSRLPVLLLTINGASRVSVGLFELHVFFSRFVFFSVPREEQKLAFLLLRHLF
jgi:hypothetical protein